ncbi:hypothetical protein [Photobacterium leiognathi]|uniref:Uncharacterized protein n=1 Tax=Photobacterium leiognathi lrivu.4.1 TaxID=1248232 RepID=A0A0U1P8S5_PHOLE|nr:hypothetical protein [Photobacterium leiognathi]PHZ59284.1 hypothetical protein CRG86_018555 [Photobacterium leiognathi]GAD30764.1 conserved hypothetical protein [Photobacterium leiognathi lrivu.4.1]
MKKLPFKLLTKNSVISILLLVAILIIPDKNFMNIPSHEIKQLLLFILCVQGMKTGSNTFMTEQAK